MRSIFNYKKTRDVMYFISDKSYNLIGSELYQSSQSSLTLNLIKFIIGNMNNDSHILSNIGTSVIKKNYEKYI